MKRAGIWFLLILFLSVTSLGAEEEQEDLFTEALAAAGLETDDLGFEPKAYWTRFPNPGLIPYKPILFDDLLAEPLRIYDTVRIMALSAEDFLAPAYMEKEKKGLFKVAYFTGLEKKVGGFRAYGSALSFKPEEKEPLLCALRSLYTMAGRVFQYQVLGNKADWPLTEKELRIALEPIPSPLRPALAQGLLSLLEARHWVQTGLRNVDEEDLLKVWRIRDLTETQFDAMDYYPEVDDAAIALDEHSLYYGGMKIIESVEILMNDLRAALKELDPKALEFEPIRLETPMGCIILSGTGNDRHSCAHTMMVVDLGGNDTYLGPAGATCGPEMPAALCLDLSGSDTYRNDDKAVPAQGAALFGAAVLLDAEGDDYYTSKYVSQGAGQFGMGLLADLAGDDRYTMEVCGQGAAVFGIGLLMDLAGNDSYRLYGDGQGYGGVGAGVGTLVDMSGDDLYYAEPKAEVFYRPDYHGWMEYNYSYAQGAGIGRRGDISDGHSWGGGTGTLIDLAGNDHYISGTWSLGSSYWFGLGFLYDKGGDDIYESCTFSQASGAHFCVAGLIDEGGDDRHTVYGKSTCAVGFGHDYTVALYLDRDGNDTYEAFDGCFGRAIRVSQAFFLELAGDDTYRVKEGAKCLGSTDCGSRLEKPNLDFTYELYSKQFGIFLDGGGTDQYLEPEGEDAEQKGYWKWGVEIESTRFRNNTRWFDPGLTDPLCRGRHFGIGVDHEASELPPIPWCTGRFSSIHKK